LKVSLATDGSSLKPNRGVVGVQQLRHPRNVRACGVLAPVANGLLMSELYPATMARRTYGEVGLAVMARRASS
jgi:hypothetical protein